MKLKKFNRKKKQKVETKTLRRHKTKNILDYKKGTCTKIELNESSYMHYNSNLPQECQLSSNDYVKLWNEHPLERDVAVFGVETPRWHMSIRGQSKIGSYGSNYIFSRRSHPPHQLQDTSITLIDKLHEYIYAKTGAVYNQVLVNWYKDGQDSIDWHSDNESQLVDGMSIFSFTYLAKPNEIEKRIFEIRSKEKKSTSKQTKKQKQKTKTKTKKTRSQRQMLKVFLKHNSCIEMGGAMQKHYEHRVPKQPNYLSSRINITFRCFAPSFSSSSPL